MTRTGLVLLLLTPIIVGQDECSAPGTGEAIQPAVTIQGVEPDALVGRQVAIGDFNGDGHGDLVISSPREDVEDLIDAGIIHIFYGPVDEGVALAQSDAQLTGPETEGLAGLSISNVGDVNADGKQDLLIGVHHVYGGLGASYLFYGPMNGALPLEEADAVFYGTEDGVSWVGFEVSGAGDINADGFADVLIDAHNSVDENGEAGGGHAFLMYGPLQGAYLLPSDGHVVFGDDTSLNHVAGAGDVNADGFDDVLLGAEFDGLGSEGRAYLFYGPLTEGMHSVATADATLVGEHGSVFCNPPFCAPIGDEAGSRVGPAGDVNQDGFDDVYISADSWPRGDNYGAVYLLLGPLSGEISLAQADVGFFAEEAGTSFGVVALSADLNGDGILDTVVGASQYTTDDEVGGEIGALYVFYGPLAGDYQPSDAALWLTGSESLGAIGLSVATIPDVDGDGVAELLMGAPNRESDPAWPGAVYQVPSLSFR